MGYRWGWRLRRGAEPLEREVRLGFIPASVCEWLNLARIEILALSAREIGQFALARKAASTKSLSAILGTVATTSR